MNRGEPHHTAGVGDSSKAGNEKQVSPTASLSSINMLISPGWILTEMANAAFDVADNPSNARKDALQRHPAGRMGQPNRYRQYGRMAGFERIQIRHWTMLCSGRRIDRRFSIKSLVVLIVLRPTIHRRDRPLCLSAEKPVADHSSQSGELRKAGRNSPVRTDDGATRGCLGLFIQRIKAL